MQYSDIYYLQLQQQNGERTTRFAIPRNRECDDNDNFTQWDTETADYHAVLAAKAGIFEFGYYDLSLYEYYNFEPIETEHRIL